MTDNQCLCFSDVSQAFVLGVVGCVGSVDWLLEPGVGPVCLRSSFAQGSLAGVRLQWRKDAVTETARRWHARRMATLHNRDRSMQ